MLLLEDVTLYPDSTEEQSSFSLLMGVSPMVRLFQNNAWLVELIQFMYNKGHLRVSLGVKDHQTRKQATCIADLAGVDPPAHL